MGSPAAFRAPSAGSSGSKARVRARRLNIREAPDAAADRVAGYLRDGTVVSVLEARAGWCRVAVELEGWVATRYIEAG